MGMLDFMLKPKDSTEGTIEALQSGSQPANTFIGLPVQILGFNCQIDFCRYSFDNDVFVDVMKSTGATGFRTPGGTLGNSFRPFDLNSKPQIKDVGNLYAKTKAKIFIVLNMLTSSLDEQLRWLKALSDNQVQFDFVELGNEFPSDTFYTKYTPETYIKTCKQWIAEIRKNYPNVRFGVPSTGTRKWNSAMLTIDPKIFMVWHYHNREHYLDDNGNVDIQKVWSLIDAYKKDNLDFVPWSQILITEFNLKVKKPGGVEEDVVFKDDTQHGIAASCMMEKFYKSGASAVLFHNISGAQDNGAIIDGPNNNIYLSPTGLAIQKFIATTL